MKLIRSTYLTDLLFYLLGGVIFILGMGFVFEFLILIGMLAFGIVMILLIVDLILLHRLKDPIRAKRELPKLFSLHDPNPVRLIYENQSDKSLTLRIVDELPFQFQKRDFVLSAELEPGESRTEQYELTPVKRGEYEFGKINVFLSSAIGLAERRIQLGETQMVKVYPSIIQMRAYELMVFSADRAQEGIKKIRRLGHGYEFSDIRKYVVGDDPRTINWKASSRSTELMVNNYQDERSQAIYAVINTSRVMRMPFNGLSLMDYSINASLALQNIVLQNQDHAGLITFSDKAGRYVRAQRKFNQRQLILESLYNIEEDQGEPNYQGLYQTIQQKVRGRSLLLLFTNFMSHNSVMRVLPELKRLNRSHLLVVIFFQNTELKEFEQKELKSVLDIASNVMASKLLNELNQVIYELRNNGIQVIYTKPEELTANSINKYLELKSLGQI